MSAGNVESVWRHLEAVNNADVEALVGDVAEDMVFLPRRSALHGEYRGVEGLRKFFADNNETFEVFTLRFDEVLDAGDQVVGLGRIHVRPRGGGPDTEVEAALVYTFEHGKAVRVEDFGIRQVALAAAGLSA